MRKSALNNNKTDNYRLCEDIIKMARAVYKENGCHDIVFVSGGKAIDGDNKRPMDKVLPERGKEG